MNFAKGPIEANDGAVGDFKGAVGMIDKAGLGLNAD